MELTDLDYTGDRSVGVEGWSPRNSDMPELRRIPGNRTRFVLIL
jgi:hypothetical protein